MAEDNTALRYKSLFTLSNSKLPDEQPSAEYEVPDRRDGLVYVYDAELKLAVEVALVTGRPLLLRGEPGSGKSSLAAYVARNLNWRYYEHVITARTQARDLLWTYDPIRRLKDAQVKKEKEALYDYDYVEPGALWWVLDRDSATLRGAPRKQPPALAPGEPNAEINASRSPHHAVLLIDEIDKADPDVPNNLLVPLGSLAFRVDETGTEVKRKSTPRGRRLVDRVSNLLIILTTNEERELPQAFLRRCIVHELRHPDPEQLVEIAKGHFERKAPLTEDDLTLFRVIAQKVEEHRQQAKRLGVRKPSTAEYLDAVRACRKLKIEVGSPTWERIVQVVLLKRRDGEEEGA